MLIPRGGSWKRARPDWMEPAGGPRVLFASKGDSAGRSKHGRIYLLWGSWYGVLSRGRRHGAAQRRTEDCLSCHASLHPGMVGDWKMSRHARTPRKHCRSRFANENVFRKIPDNLLNNSIGCAECHTLSPDKHKDSFEHNGYQVHVVVSPADCATCHSAGTRAVCREHHVVGLRQPGR